jgi:hypothetical protein
MATFNASMFMKNQEDILKKLTEVTEHQYVLDRRLTSLNDYMMDRKFSDMERKFSDMDNKMDQMALNNNVMYPPSYYKLLQNPVATISPTSETFKFADFSSVHFTSEIVESISGTITKQVCQVMRLITAWLIHSTIFLQIIYDVII